MAEQASWREQFDARQQKEIAFAEVYARDFAHGTEGHNARLIIAKMAALLDGHDLFGPDMIEALAEYAHNSWSGWTEWMFEKWDQTHGSGETFQARWKRQLKTPYSSLSEQEKESDRKEARRILATIMVQMAIVR
jgi:hypothetical protein